MTIAWKPLPYLNRRIQQTLINTKAPIVCSIYLLTESLLWSLGVGQTNITCNRLSKLVNVTRTELKPKYTPLTDINFLRKPYFIWSSRLIKFVFCIFWSRHKVGVSRNAWNNRRYYKGNIHHVINKMNALFRLTHYVYFNAVIEKDCAREILAFGWRGIRKKDLGPQYKYAKLIDSIVERRGELLFELS